MLNLLRMDLYRILRSKSFYIFFGILLIINFLTFGLLFLLTHSGTEALTRLGFTVSSSAADISAALNDSTLLEIFAQGTTGAGSYASLLGILSTLFICIDFESGFIKNIMTAHENKWDYVFSKTLSICIINFLYLTITFLTLLLLNVVSGGLFKYPYAPDVLFYLLSDVNLSTLPTSFGGSYNLKPFLTGLIYFVIYTIISKIVLSKKDI